MIGDSAISGRDKTILDVVARNRDIVRTLYRNSMLSAGSIYSENTPLEWMRFDSPSPLDAFIDNIRNRGVHVLSGDNFFWTDVARHGRYLRIPLNRKTADVETAVATISTVLP
jgi:hypothetical protein